MKIVAFNGSPRRNGNTARLLNMVLDELKTQDFDTEMIQIGGRGIPGCIACFKCFETKNCRCAVTGDIINECIEKMMDANGILIGSPTYFSDLTADTKALIDRAGFVAKANGDILKRKAGAAVVAVRRAGAVHTFDSINHFFTINQMIIPGSSYWNLGIGLNEGDVLDDGEGIRTMKNLGVNMGWLIRKLIG